jgi:hypothetical protein
MSSRRHAFDATQIEQLLTKLGQRAVGRGLTLELTIAGGAAMALGLGARHSTHDIDVVQITPSRTVLLELAAEVASAEQLSERWVSDDAARFAPAPHLPRDRYRRACYELDDTWPKVEDAR